MTAGVLPVCEERLWVTTLTDCSMYWVIAALLESLLVAYLFFAETQEDLSREEEARKREERRLGGVVESNDADERSPDEETDSPETQENSHDDAVPSRGLVRGVSVAALKQLLVQSPTIVTESWKTHAIRKMDRVCLVVFPISYIIFISVMISRIDDW